MNGKIWSNMEEIQKTVILLVGGAITILKNMDYRQWEGLSYMENKQCSKPATIYIYMYTYVKYIYMYAIHVFVYIYIFKSRYVYTRNSTQILINYIVWMVQNCGWHWSLYINP